MSVLSGVVLLVVEPGETVLSLTFFKTTFVRRPFVSESVVETRDKTLVYNIGPGVNSGGVEVRSSTRSPSGRPGPQPVRSNRCVVRLVLHTLCPSVSPRPCSEARSPRGGTWGPSLSSTRKDTRPSLTGSGLLGPLWFYVNVITVIMKNLL